MTAVLTAYDSTCDGILRPRARFRGSVTAMTAMTAYAVACGWAPRRGDGRQQVREAAEHHVFSPIAGEER
jgi:hypothetical protein